VEAASPDEAELLALQALKREPKLDLGGGPKPENARVYFTEIVEVDRPQSPAVGMTWYAMNAPE
jgi:hypothetical protein